MKKYLLAFAAMATLCGTAAAQSNVTLYGEAEAGIGRRYTQDTTGMITNYLGTSRWGVRGTEDLGGGLKVSFNLESGALDMATGEVGGNGGFNRQAWVGIGSGFGTLMLGRTTTPQSRIMGTFDLNGTADGSSALKALKLAANGSLGGSRQNGMIQYVSPNMGGFSFNVGLARKDDTGLSKNWTQVAGAYKNKQLTVGFAVQSKMGDTANDRNGYALGAKYDFGSVVVSGLYTQDESRSDGKGFGLGVAVPLGSTTVGVQLARVTDSSNADKDGASAWELFANHKLSKRTALYAALGGVNDAAHQSVTKGAKDTTFGLGINHRF